MLRLLCQTSTKIAKLPPVCKIANKSIYRLSNGILNYLEDFMAISIYLNYVQLAFGKKKIEMF